MRENRVIKLPVFRTMIHPVARKEWICCICKQPVALGERYTHYVDRRVHEIIHHRFHDDCFLITEAYCAQRHRREFKPGSVRSWLTNNHCKSCKEDCELHACPKILAWAKVKLKEI